jgi:MFS family permease
MSRGRYALPATVVLLGIVSFFSDVASDMMYPLLPLFLSSVLGAGPVALGAIEGAAEATASLLKVVSGIRSDMTRRRVPMIVFGYGLAALARPLIGIATLWPQVLALRVMDRIGKGLRESPRDALIADAVTEDKRGIAYGYQRALDNGGSMVGPLIAAALMAGLGLDLRTLFLVAAVPGALSVLLVWVGVREAKPSAASVPPAVSLRAGWGKLGAGFKLYMVALFVFTLGGSTDAFLLLQLGNAGLPGGEIAVVWALFHGVKSVTSYGGGRLTDRIGPRPLLMMGWFFYAAVYIVFSQALTPGVLIAVFILYGVYYGLTEPSEHVWVVQLVPAELRGTGFGIYHGLIGLTSLPASLVFGLIWQQFGAGAAFLTGAGLALAGALLLTLVPQRT